MKVCNVCSRRFDETMLFCVDDGAVLDKEEFLSISTQYFAKETAGSLQPTMRLYLPEMMHVNSTPVETNSNRHLKFGLVFSIILLTLIGGTIAAASMWLSVRENKLSTVETASNKPDALKNPIETDTGSELKKVKVIAANNTHASDIEIEKPAKQKREIYNGRVIMLNAIVRTAPTMEAGEMEIVQLDAPVIIGKRAGANSPWYRVVTASGKRGWMHGNTIEFVSKT